jgi:hypothetical protein
MSCHAMCIFLILFSMLVELELSWIFAWEYLWMLRIHVNFCGFVECIFYLIEIFSPVWSFVDFLWDMFIFDLWNSGYWLDGFEIWHVYCRHLEVCHGFSPIHLSCFISVLWLVEVDACFDAMYELVWTCVDFMIFIDLLPLVQIALNLICCSLNVFCLSLNFLGIYWAILVLVWLW